MAPIDDTGVEAVAIIARWAGGLASARSLMAIGLQCTLFDAQEL